MMGFSVNFLNNSGHSSHTDFTDGSLSRQCERFWFSTITLSEFRSISRFLFLRAKSSQYLIFLTDYFEFLTVGRKVKSLIQFIS